MAPTWSRAFGRVWGKAVFHRATPAANLVGAILTIATPRSCAMA
jgi:hypothetical protein